MCSLSGKERGEGRPFVELPSVFCLLGGDSYFWQGFKSRLVCPSGLQGREVFKFGQSLLGTKTSLSVLLLLTGPLISIDN